jgi:hypothetical protein
MEVEVEPEPEIGMKISMRTRAGAWMVSMEVEITKPTLALALPPSLPSTPRSPSLRLCPARAHPHGAHRLSTSSLVTTRDDTTFAPF